MDRERNKQIQSQINDSYVVKERSMSPIMTERELNEKVDNMVAVRKDPIKCYKNNPPMKQKQYPVSQNQQKQDSQV